MIRGWQATLSRVQTRLPGAAGAVVLRRWLRGHRGARLVFVNAVLRASALGLIGALAIAGRLDLTGYVALLGASSLLSAWGVAGKYTLIADLLPPAQRIAGNSLFGLTDQLSLMLGPALAGVVTALAGPAVVISLDAASWVVLAISYARIAPLAARLTAQGQAQPPSAEPPVASAEPPSAEAPASGVGAVIGELAAPFLRRWPVWPTMTAIVIGPPSALAQVIAARSSLLILASPLGTALGGPIVAALGARGTLLASAVATIVLGLITAAVLVRGRARKARIQTAS